MVLVLVWPIAVDHDSFTLVAFIFSLVSRLRADERQFVLRSPITDTLRSPAWLVHDVTLTWRLMGRRRTNQHSSFQHPTSKSRIFNCQKKTASISSWNFKEVNICRHRRSASIDRRESHAIRRSQNNEGPRSLEVSYVYETAPSRVIGVLT